MAEPHTISIDPVAAYFKRRVEAAESDGLLQASMLREQVTLNQALIARVQELEGQLVPAAEQTPSDDGDPA